MPTYDYKCTACKHTMEAFHSMKDKPLRKCPKCGKNALERQIGTGAAVLFKGSGFYQTDYRSESYKKAAASDKPAASGSTDTAPKSDAGKSDSGSTASSTPATPAPAAADKPVKKPKKAS
jgi:putative FmdB family regulatory protein